MIVYIYDKNTGEYKYEYSPQVNPKNPQEYIYPPNSTTIKPEITSGFVAVYDGAKWVQQRDLRGETIINPETKQRGIVQSIGELPDGFVLYSEYKKSDEYKSEQELLKKESKKLDLKKQIYEIDMKRIRAISEPETRADGMSWLAYYTAQIVVLRAKLQELE